MLNAESSLNSFSLYPEHTRLAFCQDIQLHADCSEIQKCSDKSAFPGFHIYLILWNQLEEPSSNFNYQDNLDVI